MSPFLPPVDMSGGDPLVFDLGTDTLKAGFDYTYDLMGSRLTATEYDDDRTVVARSFGWGYDALNRLVNETYDGEGTGEDYTDTFAFDLASNRLNLNRTDGTGNPLSATTYTYDANDRLQLETFDDLTAANADTNTDYLWGSANEATTQTGKVVTGAQTSTTAMTYDARGRLASVSVSVNGGAADTTTYIYNDRGLRIRETSGGASTLYLFEASGGNPTGYAQVLEQGTDANTDGQLAAGEVGRTYVLGSDVLAQATRAEHVAGLAAAKELLTLLYDTHGSTRAVTDADAAAIQRFAYEAYGTHLAGTMLTAAPSAMTTLLYAGEWTVPFETGAMQYLRARWYEPRRGSFLRGDPWVGSTSNPLSLNRYAYANTDPIANIDPTGEGALAILAWALPMFFALGPIFGAGAAAYTLSSNSNRGQIIAASGGNLAANWAVGFGDVTYSGHMFAVPVAAVGNATRFMDRVYQDLENFTYFNTPGNTVATVRLQRQNARQIAYFDGQGFLLNAGDIHNGINGEVPVELLSDPVKRELTGVTLGWHMLVGVRKWDVTQNGRWIEIRTHAWERPATFGNFAALGAGRVAGGSLDFQDLVWRQYFNSLSSSLFGQPLTLATQLVQTSSTSNPWRQQLPARLR